MTPRRVLVTGAAGGIGRVACDHLADAGMSVVGLSLSGPFPASCERTIEADATSHDAVAEALDGVDAVVHLAAIPHPSIDTPFTVYSTNVTSVFAVLSAAGEAGVPRVVVASSINASGIPFNAHRVMPAYFPLDEALPIDLEDAYSLSKRTGELAAEMAARRWGTEVVSLRFPLVKEHRTLRRVAAEYRDSPETSVREGWSYLDVRDAARAIHAALTAPVEGAVVVGLSAADTLMEEETEALLAAWAPRVPITRPLPGRSAAVDTRSAELLLGFHPRYSVHDEQPRADAGEARFIVVAGDRPG